MISQRYNTHENLIFSIFYAYCENLKPQKFDIMDQKHIIYQMELQDPNTLFTLLVATLRKSKRRTQNKLSQTLRTIISMKKKDENNLNSNEIAEEKKKTIQTLQQMKKQLQDLKGEIDESFQEQKILYGQCRKRVHVDTSEEIQNENNQQKIKDQFNRAVISFFACRKKLDIAKAIDNNRQSKTKNLQLTLYEQAFKISEDISKNKLKSLKEWCYDHSHSLSKVKSSLDFKLTCCEFLNILNNSGYSKATDFLRKSVNTIYLSDEDKKELKKYTFYLIMDNKSQQLFLTLLQETKQVFLDTFQKIYKISLIPKFDKIFGIGISALKTICCCSENKKSLECPTCSPTIEKLVKSIPMVMRNQSSLHCRINNSLMNGNNYPVVLPDGSVYSYSGLESLGTSTKYRCPKTGKSYKKQACTKAFLS